MSKSRENILKFPENKAFSNEFLTYEIPGNEFLRDFLANSQEFYVIYPMILTDVQNNGCQNHKILTRHCIIFLSD